MTLARHVSFVDCPGHEMLMCTLTLLRNSALSTLGNADLNTHAQHAHAYSGDVERRERNGRGDSGRGGQRGVPAAADG